MANQPMDDFIRDQAKASIAVKTHAKSNALLYLKTIALQKAFGPLYRSWLNIKAGMIAVVKLVPGLEKGFMGLTIAASLAIKPFKGLAKSLSVIKTTMMFLIGTMLSIMGVMFLVAGSFSKAGEQFPIFSENLKRIKDAVGGVIDHFKELFEYFQSADFAPTGDALMEVFTSIANLVSGITATAIEKFAQLTIAVLSLDFTPLIALVQFVVDEIAVLWGIIEEQNWGILLSAAEGVLESVAGLFITVGESAEDGLGGVIPLMESVFDFLLGTGIAVLTGLLNVLSDVIDAAGRIDFSPLIDAINSVDFTPIISSADFTPVIDFIMSIGEELIALGAIILGLNWGGLFSAASDALNSVINLIGDMTSAMSEGAKPVLDSLNEAFKSIGDVGMIALIGLVSLFGDLVDKIGEADFGGLTSLIASVAGAITDLSAGILAIDWSRLSSAAVSVFGEILAVISSVLSSGGDIFGAFLDRIVEYYLTLGEAWVDTMSIFLESVASVIAIFGGLDLTPILIPIMGLFMIFTGLVMDFGVGFFTMMGDLFALFTTLMTYLAETGALQALIDVIGNLGIAAVAIIASIIGALDDMGINFGSIFGFITDVVSGFVMFLIESGLLAFFIEVIEVVGHVLVVVGFLIAGTITLVGKLLGYLTGPTWSILTGIIVAIVNAIAVAVALVLLPFRMFFKLVSGWIKVFVALLTEGPSAAFGELMDLIFDLAGIWDTTMKGITNAWDGFWHGIENIITGAIDLMLSPLYALKDLIDEVMDFEMPSFSDIGDAAGDWVSDKLPFFASGGISSGPTSGYAAQLHGTEAVVPLPDGKSIPVTMAGMGVTDGIIDSLTAVRNEITRAGAGSNVTGVLYAIESLRSDVIRAGAGVSNNVTEVLYAIESLRGDVIRSGASNISEVLSAMEYLSSEYSIEGLSAVTNQGAEGIIQSLANLNSEMARSELKGIEGDERIVRALQHLESELTKIKTPEGDTITLNLSVTGAERDPKEIAMIVSKEIQSLFRTRGGGFARGFF